MSRTLKLSESNIEAALGEDPTLQPVINKLKLLDRDNNNELSLTEVAACVKDLAEREKQNKLLRSLLAATGILLLIFALAIAGMTYAIVQLSKDIQVNNGILQAKDGDASSYLSTGNVRTMNKDAVGVLLSLTPANASSLQSMILPCDTCPGEGSMDVYNVDHVRLHTPGELVAVYTSRGAVIIADSEGLRLFANETEAATYMDAGDPQRRKLLGYQPPLTTTSTNYAATITNGQVITDTSVTTSTSTSTNLVILPPSSGVPSSISWDGNSGVYYGSSAPKNQANLGDAYAFASTYSGSSTHIGYPSNVMDKKYGNAASWSPASTDTDPWIALKWIKGSNNIQYSDTIVYVDSIAFGRDNSIGKMTDKTVGTYTIEYATSVPSSSFNTASWTSMGQIQIKVSDATFPGYQRHAFKIKNPYNFRPEKTKAIRIRSSTNVVAIDEIEVYGTRIDQPPIGNGEYKAVGVDYEIGFVAESSTLMPLADNIATKGKVFGSSKEVGSGFLKAINQLVGTTNSWKPANNDTAPWIGIEWTNLVRVGGFAFSNDAAIPDGGQQTYLVQVTSVALASTLPNLPESQFPNEGWTTVSNITHTISNPRREYLLRWWDNNCQVACTNTNPKLTELYVRALRIKLDQKGTLGTLGIDELEVKGYL